MHERLFLCDKSQLQRHLAVIVQLETTGKCFFWVNLYHLYLML